MSQHHVLVVGPRRPLLDVLRERDIPFTVWRDKASASAAGAEQVVTAPLWNTAASLRSFIDETFGTTQFTHVIAGTDAAVHPASVARRRVGARLSVTTTALRCRDKLAMKEYLSGFDIPMTDFMPESSVASAAEAFARLGTPVVRKLRKSSGTRGMEFIHEPERLVLRRNGRNLLERYVSAPEASIESFVNGGDIKFINTTRYLEKGHVNFVPSALDEDVLESMLSLNRRVIEALKIEWGITHLEVYLCEDGILFGEIALRPPGGYIMNAMQYAYEFDPWQALVAMELDESFGFPSRPTGYCCAEVFHPGAGTVAAIHGEEAVANHPATREFRIKVRQGDTIFERESVGQDVGYLLHTSAFAERQTLYEYFQGVLGFVTS